MFRLYKLSSVILTIVILLASPGPAMNQTGYKRDMLVGINIPWWANSHDFGSNAWGHDGVITCGWSQSNYPDSKGFIDVSRSFEKSHSGAASLRIRAEMQGGVNGKDRGETYLDLNNHAPVGISPPLSLTNSTLRFWIYLPPGAAGPVNKPNGIQIFLKSEGFRSFYSQWKNIDSSWPDRWVSISINLADPPAYVDSGFDMTKVIIIGIKIAVNPETNTQLIGDIYIDDFMVESYPSLSFDFERLEAETDFEQIHLTMSGCASPVVRVFIFGDGCASPEFNYDGSVAGFDKYFFPDFDAMLASARRYGLRVIPVIVDYGFFNWPRVEDEVQRGGHYDIITDSAKLRTFIDNAIRPIAERYKDNESIYAWEIINEPEWTMTETAGVSCVGPGFTTVSMQEFVRECALAIKQVSNNKVTVGSSRRSWVHYWKGLGLDLYQFHWYDEQAQSGSSDVFPWEPVSELGLDGPCLVGEVPMASTQYNPVEYLTSAYNGGYEGVLFWSYRSRDKYSNFSKIRDSLAKWCCVNNSPISNVRYDNMVKKLIIEGGCFDEVAGVIINHKQADPGRIEMYMDRITVYGKAKKIGIKPGLNSAQILMKDGSVSEEYSFVLTL